MYDFIVVGAGIGGLYCAKQLADKKVVVIESADHVGGRCVTATRRREKGAWRVHSSHSRSLALMRDLNINIVPTRSSKVEKQKRSDLPPMAKRAKKGMTLFETMLLKHGVSTAQDIDQNTGYMGITKTSSASYSASDNKYFVPRKGMGELPKKLSAKLKIMTNSRVAYIRFLQKQKTYEVYVMIRKEDHPNKFTKKVFRTKGLILNCQPIHFPDTNFNRKLSLIRHVVSTEPLTHVYVTLTKPLPPTYKVTNNLLGQVVSITPTQLMISYSGGDLATFHYHFHMNHPEEYATMLKQCLPSCDFTDIEVFHHKYGVGLWNPNPAGQSIQLMEKCAVIHPIHLPGLYCVNENISARYQGWAEGTLEVAELVLDYIRERKTPTVLTTMPKEYLVYDKRVLDVSKWKAHHPGSQQAIENHLGEDITDLFDNIHSTKSEAMQYILGFQVGFIN